MKIRDIVAFCNLDHPIRVIEKHNGLVGDAIISPAILRQVKNNPTYPPFTNDVEKIEVVANTLVIHCKEV